jgi:hypothetical protein
MMDERAMRYRERVLLVIWVEGVDLICSNCRRMGSS